MHYECAFSRVYSMEIRLVWFNKLILLSRVTPKLYIHEISKHRSVKIMEFYG